MLISNVQSRYVVHFSLDKNKQVLIELRFQLGNQLFCKITIQNLNIKLTNCIFICYD